MSSRQTAAQPGNAGQAAATRLGGDAALGRCAAAGIIAFLLIMIAASLLRRSWQPQVLIMPAGGPPWQTTGTVSARAIVVALWLGAVLGAAGVIAGLIAVRRGLAVPVRTLLMAAAAAVAVLVLLPPVGSTDSLDYAVYGQVAALGHSPYVVTPLRYTHLIHVRLSAPLDHASSPSYYGPLATAEQFVAARLAGPDIARTVLWLKLFNAVAFAAVAVAAEWRFRGDRASRVRAHLLWTANPLLIWSLVASAHLDVLAAAVGVSGLLLVDRRLVGNRAKVAGEQRNLTWLWALAAGACVGAAADIKIDYILFALAIGWALRTRPGQLLAAAGGGAAVLVPSYAIAGLPALRTLTERVSVGPGWQYWLLLDHLGIPLRYAVPVATGLMFPLAALALARMPTGLAVPSAIRAGLAFSLAWLLLWPHQYAWYSAMIICTLVFYPRSRVDWVAVAAFAGISIASIPGVDLAAHRVLGDTLKSVDYQDVVHLGPAVLLSAAGAFVIMCINQRWQARPLMTLSRSHLVGELAG